MHSRSTVLDLCVGVMYVQTDKRGVTGSTARVGRAQARPNYGEKNIFF